MLFKDLLHTVRVLRNDPVFTVTAAITLALGIGASAAIFSVSQAILLRPLPYKDPGRLVLAFGDMKQRNVKDLPFSNADFFDLRNGTKNVFDDFAAVLTRREILPKEDGSPEQVRIASVTPNFLRLLGGKIVVGRDFADADGQPQSANPAIQRSKQFPSIAILSYEYWQRRYGGDRSVVGRRTADGGAQIVGVLAPDFPLLFPPNMNMERTPDLWIAARLSYDNAQRNTFAFRAIGRLKPGVTFGRAQAQANMVAGELRRLFPIAQTSGFHIRLEPMHQYLVADVQPAILALMGAVVCLLLISWANVANLLLVRASWRTRELAIRTALGGGRWRLIWQILMEALLLACMGTLLGLGIASFGIHELLAVAPMKLPRTELIRIDPGVIVFASLTGLAAAAIFGIVPAFRASRPDVMQVLRGSSRTSGLASGRLLRNSVVIAEVALSFVLLIGSGLMLRSFVALQRIDPGYDAHGLLTFQVLGPTLPNPQQRAAFMRQIRETLFRVPGVRNVTAASPFPLADVFFPIRWGTEQALTDASKFRAVDLQFVLPGYFETLRTPLIAGRTFTDVDNASDRNVVLVDQFLAAKAFPHESAVGKRILIRIRTPEPEWVQIIGVVAHQRDTSLAEMGREQIYFADGFNGHGLASRWAVRTDGDPNRIAADVRSAIARVGGSLLINEMQPMDAWVTQAQAGTRFALLLMSVFAAAAALLACIGLYGVLSTIVRQRTAEIGVRMALGAVPRGIFRLVVGHGLCLSAAGIGIGVLVALGLTRLMTNMLVGVQANDPLTFVAMGLFFLVIAAIASWVPGRRAAALDPSVCLRDE